MRLIDADELKKCAIPCEIHNGASTELCVPIYQIDNAPICKPCENCDLYFKATGKGGYSE